MIAVPPGKTDHPGVGRVPRTPSGRRITPSRNSSYMRNGKGVALELLGGTCGLLGDSCGSPELPRRDADHALELMGELALVREAGVGGDLHQGQVAAAL